MPEEKIEIGCVAVKDTTQKKTGSWRSFCPVVTDKCRGCGHCVSICPEGCISLDEKKKAKINYDYCKGCLICLTECPFKAIIKEEEKRQ